MCCVDDHSYLWPEERLSYHSEYGFSYPITLAYSMGLYPVLSSATFRTSKPRILTSSVRQSHEYFSIEYETILSPL